MKFRASLLLLLIALIPLPSSGAESARMLLERGVFTAQGLRSGTKAKFLFLQALKAPDASPWVAAEALWQMAQVYEQQGSNETAVMVLAKLTKDYPDVTPFSSAAREKSVDLTRELVMDYEYPNMADNTGLQELAGMAKAALKLNSTVEYQAIMADLVSLLECILFELELPLFQASAQDRRERKAFHQDFLGYHLATSRCLKEAQPNDGEFYKALEEMAERDQLKNDLQTPLCQARDAIITAISEADSAKFLAAHRRLAEMLTPLTEGPKDLAMTQHFTGELAGIHLVKAMVEKQDFPAALSTWRKSRTTLLDSNVAGSHIILPDFDKVPLQLRPKIISCLFFVEMAIHELTTDDQKQADELILQGIERFQKLLATVTDPAVQKRLQGILKHMEGAHTAISDNDKVRAEDLLRLELYMGL
jgi:hypothetical protein